jgi:hypothetical protein
MKSISNLTVLDAMTKGKKEIFAEDKVYTNGRYVKNRNIQNEAAQASESALASMLEAERATLMGLRAEEAVLDGNPIMGVTAESTEEEPIDENLSEAKQMNAAAIKDTESNINFLEKEIKSIENKQGVKNSKILDRAEGLLVVNDKKSRYATFQ